MSQPTDFSVPLTAPATKTGMASRMDGSFNALLTQHSGSARPDYAEPNTIWADTSVSGVTTYMYYDGTNDRVLYSITSTGVVTLPAITLSGDIDLDGNKLLNNIAAQRLFAEKTDTMFISGGTSTTVLELAITPSTATSKIFITGKVEFGADARYAALQIYRDGTLIGAGDADGSRQRVMSGAGISGVTEDQYVLHPVPFTFVDSPATTSEVTYTIKAGNVNGNSLYINRPWHDVDSAFNQRAISTLVLEESVS